MIPDPADRKTFFSFRTRRFSLSACSLSILLLLLIIILLLTLLLLLIIILPVSQWTNEGVDEQLDDSFRSKQQTNSNIFFFQKQTVLKTGRALTKGNV